MKKSKGGFQSKTSITYFGKDSGKEMKGQMKVSLILRQERFSSVCQAFFKTNQEKLDIK